MKQKNKIKKHKNQHRQNSNNHCVVINLVYRVEYIYKIVT